MTRRSEATPRWNVLALSLWRELTPDLGLSRKLHDGFARAWRDRERWPETIKRRFADYRMDEVAAFLKRVSTDIRASMLSRPSGGMMPVELPTRP